MLVNDNFKYYSQAVFNQSLIIGVILQELSWFDYPLSQNTNQHFLLR